MMLDGGVVFIVIIIVVIIAFIKGYTHEKNERKHDNPLDKYSDADLQRFKDIIKDLENSKK